MKLEGKIAVITGAGRGIGRATALEMSKEGASVVIPAGPLKSFVKRKVTPKLTAES